MFTTNDLVRDLLRKKKFIFLCSRFETFHTVFFGTEGGQRNVTERIKTWTVIVGFPRLSLLFCNIFVLSSSRLLKTLFRSAETKKTVRNNYGCFLIVDVEFVGILIFLGPNELFVTKLPKGQFRQYDFSLRL